MTSQSHRDCIQYSSSPADLPADRPTKRSNNVPPARSKNVLQRQRRTSLKSRQTIEKIRSFAAALEQGAGETLVGNSPPPKAYPTPYASVPSSTPKPVNDNIPVWELTDDIEKVFAASIALQLEDTHPVSFTFNLIPGTIAAASKHPHGFVDFLKRRLDKALLKAGAGQLPYWFCIDIDKNKRLHVHGAYLPVGIDMRAVLKTAWGEWEGVGRQFQIKLNPDRCDEGWAVYSTRNRKQVTKVIGARTCTITRELRNQAKATYGEVRKLMQAFKRSGRND